MSASDSSPLPASPYSVHPVIADTQKAIAALPAKTGRTLEEWIALVQAQDSQSESELRAWLKSDYQLGTNYAWWIVELAAGRGKENNDPQEYLRVAAEWVEAMYAGPKAALTPIHQQLMELGQSLGSDVKFCPCKTIIPLYRKHVFAQIKPATNTRIDLGFALGATPVSGRLIDTGGFARHDRITHRIPITSVEEIDEEVRKWLKTAYERDI